MTHRNKDSQVERAAGITDAEIAGIMGWRGPGAYTDATFRKIKRIIEADRLARQDQQPARASIKGVEFFAQLEAVCNAWLELDSSVEGGEATFEAADKLKEAQTALIAHINAWGGVTEDHTKPEK